MTGFNQHALELLEFSKIKEKVLDHTVSFEGRELLLSQNVISNTREIVALKNKVMHLKDFISKFPFPALNFPQIRSFIKKISKEGTSLDLEELFSLGSFSRSVSAVKIHLEGNPPNKEIRELADSFPETTSIQEIIFKIIDRNGELRDLPELKEIRRKIFNITKDISVLVQAYLQDDNKRIMLQSDIPTQKDGRTVLSVKANFKGRIKGIIHEVSSTGQTIFIEPEDILNKNNELVQEEARYRQEIMRILRLTTDRLRPYYETIELMVDSVAVFDSVFARASYSSNPGYSFAVDSMGEIRLEGARHPLLGYKAVPIDLSIPSGIRTLIITGPNTGGKTVSLKTLGLFVAMNQFGLAIPVNENSWLPCFDSIFADIGDEQSINQSLSTFSAHMKNMAFIIEEATDQSLVLLDELGSGTDPEEGSAIAMSLLDLFIERGSRTLVTTHHGILKNYGYSKQGVENASVDFDKDTLSPTYRIVMGIPGESHALDVAAKNGLPMNVVNKARSYLNEERTDISELISGLKSKHEEFVKAESEQKERIKTLEENRRSTDLISLQLRQKEYLLKTEGVGEIKRILSESRKTLENLVRELKEGELSREKTIKVKEFLSDLEGKVKLQEESLANIVPAFSGHEGKKIEPGVSVRIKSSRKNGIIVRRGKKGYWVVETDTMKMSIPDMDLQAIDSADEKKVTVTYAATSDSKAVLELDIRGMRFIEAIKLLERQIDAAAMQNLTCFGIIHGMGEGILQKGVHEYLKTSPVVASFCFARPEDGGFGKTVVELKK